MQQKRERFTLSNLQIYMLRYLWEGGGSPGGAGQFLDNRTLATVVRRGYVEPMAQDGKFRLTRLGEDYLEKITIHNQAPQRAKQGPESDSLLRVVRSYWMTKQRKTG